MIMRNRKSNRMQPWCTSEIILNILISPSVVLTLQLEWSYRELKILINLSGMPYSFNVVQMDSLFSVHAVKSFLEINIINLIN